MNKEEKTMEENLKDPVYVNYNLLLKLDEIKRINYSILEILNQFYLKFQQEEKESKEEREGVFKSK